MKVEIWSDFVCPFCYIGKRRLEAALEQFPHKDNVEVVYRSFELDPHTKRDQPPEVYDYLSRKYGMSREQAKATTMNVTAQAQTAGLTYRFDGMVMANTFDAHRLAHFAAKQGKGREMTERLLYAYFTESRHIGDRETLAALAAEAGLDRAEAARILASEEYSEEVRADEEEAARLGIRGVPYFVINRKYAVSGAQPTELFLEALQKAWDEDKPLTVLNSSPNAGTADATDAACADGVCAPPAQKQ